MKAKVSPLELSGFYLIQSSYDWILPKDEEINIPELLQSYAIDIDFDHFPQEDNGLEVHVVIKVNKLKRPKPGYSFEMAGVGHFRIRDQEKIDENLLNNLRQYSTTNMLINNLRNVMYQLSNMGPMGGYQLPPIDILDLFKKKEKEEKKNIPDAPH